MRARVPDRRRRSDPVALLRHADPGLRILHVDTAREWRGGQVQLLELLRRAPGEHVVALPPDAALASILARHGIPMEAVPFHGEVGGTRGLAAAVRAVAPDVVAAHTPHALAHALRATSLPVVAHRRVDFRPNVVGRLRLRRASRVVAVSRAVSVVVLGAGVPAERVEVVHDGVEVPVAERGERSVLHDLAPGAPMVLAVGALVPHKGHATLVRALPSLPGVHVAIAGDGPLRAALAREAAGLGVGARLHLLGQRTDVPSLLASADVFCHPSHEEGLGQVVIEALLLGAAVVASRAGGVAEVVEGRGWLVPPRDPGALAEALGRALRDPAPLRELAAADFSALRRDFSVDRMTRETMAAYARAAGS